jgi:hypothetical protein
MVKLTSSSTVGLARSIEATRTIDGVETYDYQLDDSIDVVYNALPSPAG